jgi:hypothetical protein
VEDELALRRLQLGDGALVYGLLGLFCTPGAELLTEGELVLASDLEITNLGRRIVRLGPPQHVP